jgi:TonB family protein
MMIAVADLAQALLETTVATTAAVLLVLALRRRLRVAFGATVAYAAWALVPVAVIAVLLPAATRPVMAVPMVQVLAIAPAALPLRDAGTAIDWQVWLGGAWMLGALLAAMWFARQQRGFRQGLGALRWREDGLQQAEAVDGLPAAIGLWKPAIVLPADFDARYSREQRALMVAHERMHIIRGDLHANALTAALRCVFWFNPLLHVAARHFRHDQELACDLGVITRHPHARRAYGEAMFKTQMALQPLPLGCHWGSHPLKERIAMLKQPVPSLSRWIGGAVLVGVLGFGVGFAAWSSQPSRVSLRDVPAGHVMSQIAVSIDGSKPEHFNLVSKAGEPFAMRTEHGGQHWEMQATAAPRGDGTVAFESSIRRDGKLVGTPKLLVREGARAGIQIEENIDGARKGIKLDLVVTAAAPPPPPPAPPAPPAPPVPAPPAPPAVPAIPSVAPVAPAPPPALPAPAYPKEALARHVSGKVVLLVDVDAQGNATHVVVDRSEPAGVFDQASIEAARKWKFQPAVENGQPVAGRIRVPVRFESEGNPDRVRPEDSPQGPSAANARG